MAADPVTTDQLELDDEWSLWREFAVRSAGFPVEGLEANPVGLAWRSDALTPLLRNFLDYARASAATCSLVRSAERWGDRELA